MPKSKFIRKITIVFLGFCSLLPNQDLFAQSRASDLEGIGRKMFRERHDRFILVEAFKDGFIIEGERYEFRYKGQVISVNGKALPEPYQTHYQRLMKKYDMMDVAGRGQSNTHDLSIRSTGMKLKDVLNPESSFRKPFYSRRYDTLKSEVTGTLIMELAADGIADTTREVSLRYSAEGLLVNMRPLPASLNTKYTLRIIELKNN